MTAVALKERGPELGARRAERFRPEIQGLRAVAVLLVVLFHLWPNRLTGGYVGVDVFFVISGYLITSHIHRELEATGSISLRRFWARRIRRLLPASLLVLAVCAVAVVAVVPATMWAQTARQIGASALYVQNWALAGDAVDYLAADNVPTVAQHYWSLSVEEQFYLVWPVLLLGLAALHRMTRRSAAARRWYLVAGLALLAAISLVWSVVATQRDQASAYFITPTRAWEFAAGALLGIISIERSANAKWRGPLAWAGLAAIVLAGVTFDKTSLFPGWIALLPVLGTVAVIAAGNTPGWATPAPWLSLAPMRFIGDVSYSVYLWHWPLIVVWPFVTGVRLRTVDKFAIVVATVVLAWLSKIWVEDPARVRPLLAAAPWRSFAFAGAGMAVVVAGCVAITVDVDRRGEQAAARSAEAMASGCYGPEALDPTKGCSPVEGNGALVPPPEVVVKQNAKPLYRGCQQSVAPDDLRTCTLGSVDPEPTRVVALVGDSHATQWFPAFDKLGKELNWQIRTYAKTSCPIMTAIRTLPKEQTNDSALSCERWVANLRHELAAATDVSYVFTAAFSTAYGYRAPDGHPLADPRTDGFKEVWSEWAARGKEVFVLSDVPRTDGENVPNCLAAHPDDRMACAVPRAEALPGSAPADAARQMGDPHVHLIDLSSYMCDAKMCYPVVGNLIVYRDYSHLSAEYATALVPYIEADIAHALG